MITSLKVVFHHAGTFESYTASNVAFDLNPTFSNGNTVLTLNNAGAQWLEIISYAPDSIIIRDYNTQSTIHIYIAKGRNYNICVSSFL